jgi:hypothetical protein
MTCFFVNAESNSFYLTISLEVIRENESKNLTEGTAPVDGRDINLIERLKFDETKVKSTPGITRTS